MKLERWTIAILGVLGIAAGAFGAHALRDYLLENGLDRVWDKAVLYHLIHTVALLFTLQQNPFPRKTFWFWTTGIVLFSGSLYLLALTEIKGLGAVTPIGGIFFILGWLSLACNCFCKKN
jgi:uncharacterized membrane protein YgdD (TMEM256/DUF423 family)